MHKIVFLDRSTIAPQMTLCRPAFPHTLTEHQQTAPGEGLERLAGALVHKSDDGRGAAAIAVIHAMRCDTGMPSRVIRLSTEPPTRASVFWPGRVRARRRRPMMAL